MAKQRGSLFVRVMAKNSKHIELGIKHLNNFKAETINVIIWLFFFLNQLSRDIQPRWSSG